MPFLLCRLLFLPVVYCRSLALPPRGGGQNQIKKTIRKRKGLNLQYLATTCTWVCRSPGWTVQTAKKTYQFEIWSDSIRRFQYPLLEQLLYDIVGQEPLTGSSLHSSGVFIGLFSFPLEVCPSSSFKYCNICRKKSQSRDYRPVLTEFTLCRTTIAHSAFNFLCVFLNPCQWMLVSSHGG